MLKELENLKDSEALDDLEKIERLPDSKTYDKDQDISI